VLARIRAIAAPMDSHAAKTASSSPLTTACRWHLRFVKRCGIAAATVYCSIGHATGTPEGGKICFAGRAYPESSRMMRAFCPAAGRRRVL
jgi:hypothetical protein